MKSLLLFILLSVTILSVYGQNKFLELSIPDYPEGEISLCSQFGEKSKIIETLRTDKAGQVKYEIVDLEIGVYRLYFENEEYFDIILNNENIQLSLLAKAPLESMEVIASDENKMLYNFLKQSSEINQKLEVLQYFLAKYSKGKLYKKVSAEYQKVLKEEAALSGKVINENVGSFAARIIKYYINPVIPKSISESGAETIYLRDNYFIFYPFDDTLLCYSPVYSSTVLNYLKLFTVPGNYESSVKGFKTAAQNLLNFCQKNDVVFAHVLKILIDGFESLQLFDVADELLANYGSKCINSDNMSTRYRNLTELPVGSKAPVLRFNDENGVSYEQKYDKTTLVVFWATWCEHCRQVIPTLNEYFRTTKRNDIRVILISLDTNPDDLKRFVEMNKIDFQIVCDYKSWIGVYANDFAIYATPFFYLIDHTGTIVGKPHDYDELLNEISKK